MLSFQKQQVKSSTQKAEAKSSYVRIMGPLPTSPFPGAKSPPRMLKNCNLTQFGSSGTRCPRILQSHKEPGASAPVFSSHLIMLISYPRAVRNCLKMALPDIKTLNELKHSSYLLWKPRFRNQFTSPVWSLDQQHEIVSIPHSMNQKLKLGPRNLHF